MTQSTDAFKLKRIKYLFGLFVKQFTAEEYKLLMQFLQLSINRYNDNSSRECQNAISPRTKHTGGSTKRKPTHPTGPRQNPKIGKIEQTINMLKNRNELTDEEIPDVLLDAEELHLIEILNQKDVPTTASPQFNDIEDYDDSEYINYDSCCPDGDYNVEEYEDEFNNYVYDEEEEDGEARYIAEDGNLTPSSDYNSKKGVLGGLVANSKVQVNSPRKFIRKFDDEIRDELERKFLENNFISGVEKDQLAVRLNLTERQVKKWFEKRREKKRRMEKMNLSGSGKAGRGKVATLTKRPAKEVVSSQALMSQMNEAVAAKAYLDMLVGGTQYAGYSSQGKLNVCGDCEVLFNAISGF
jgi:hypothetical protein